MTVEDRQKIIDQLFEECRTILQKKGHDYAGARDSLANFKRNAERLGLTKYQIWAVYFNKHIDAINNSIKAAPDHPQVESEPLAERIKDAINYLGILRSLLAEDKSGATQIDVTEYNRRIAAARVDADIVDRNPVLRGGCRE